MKACFQVSTGKFLEAQSDPNSGTMIANAILAGYPKDDLIEREISADDFAKLIAPPSSTAIVTPRQARLALLAAGLLDQVQTAVDAAGGATKIAWEYATEISRDDPLISDIGAALGIGSDQIDALFAQAVKL